jgi:hypothetical protein
LKLPTDFLPEQLHSQGLGRSVLAGATDPEILEDVSPVFDWSAVKHILEKAVEIAEELKAISEWHRRMSHESLNQKGQRYNLDHFVLGAKVYFNWPPSVLDVAKKTRKDKHIDHYIGPATIVKKIGSCSFQLSFVNPSTGTTQLLQRDADIILKKLAPARHQVGVKPRVGEMLVILMDYPDSKDSYICRWDMPSPEWSVHCEWFHHYGISLGRVRASNQEGKG